MPNTQQPERRLPGPIIDFLKLQAEIHGGIGRESFEDSKGRPLCAYGLCSEVFNPLIARDEAVEARGALKDAGISTLVNDNAVQCVQQRLGLKPNARIPFEEWAAELNVVPMENLEEVANA
jgi:hypothetical protein